MTAVSNKPVRCAIYTRVSTDQGLDQDFNSLDAQYEASQAYIRSQAHAGWTLLRGKYDDGGFSGGDTDRPALQRLLDDVRAGKVDVIVVYKVDRLTRSLADFAKLVELFDRHNVSFVSVTQQFNTTTSMGRLTLNVLLSFAQFEREVTSERIRDKIAASKRKGLWVGGMAPLGYDTKDRKISVNEPEAELVRTIFRRYLNLSSINLLVADLRKSGLVTKARTLRTGGTVGGIPFGRGMLAHVLRNRFYIGEVVFKGEVLAGEQFAIVDRTLFDSVQAKLTEHLLLAVPAAGFLVRLFMIQHDCGHGAFFPRRSANDWVGRVIGVLTLTPYDYWRRKHAIHHATSGNLERRGIGDVDTLTVHEYLARSRWGRLRYRLYRHPLVMFLAWMKQAFAAAKGDNSRGLVLMVQANPGFENHWPARPKQLYFALFRGIRPPDPPHPTAYDDYIEALAEELESFDKPVAFLHGDTHTFRMDQPLFSKKTGRRFENFTRVETFGAPETHWVRATADPADPQIFRFNAELIPENVANRRR